MSEFYSLFDFMEEVEELSIKKTSYSDPFPQLKDGSSLSQLVSYRGKENTYHHKGTVYRAFIKVETDQYLYKGQRSLYLNVCHTVGVNRNGVPQGYTYCCTYNSIKELLRDWALDLSKTGLLKGEVT